MSDVTAKELAQKALQANKNHQYALKIYTERLEAELESLDKLVASVESAESAADTEVSEIGTVTIPGASKPLSLVPLNSLLSEDSPFYADASWCQQYQESTSSNPMKSKEHEALADSIRTENYRIAVLEAQQRGGRPFESLEELPSSHFEINKEGINWQRIAQQVSSSSVGSSQRSADECRIRWLGCKHPELNHNDWTVEESEKLSAIVSDDGYNNWQTIAEQLGTHRTPLDCMLHGLQRKNHVWDAESDNKLSEAVRIFGVNSWNLVARMVSDDVTGHQCQKRWQDSLEFNIKKGSWSEDEDLRLHSAVEVFGTSWPDVALFVRGRTNNQCRERWHDRLNVDAKGRWNSEEDRALLETVNELGTFDWKTISERLGNKRIAETCRRRYEYIINQNDAHNKDTRGHAQDVVITTKHSQPTSTGSLPPSRKRKRAQAVAKDINKEPQYCTPTVEVSKPKARPRQNFYHSDGEATTEIVKSPQVDCLNAPETNYYDAHADIAPILCSNMPAATPVDSNSEEYMKLM